MDPNHCKVCGRPKTGTPNPDRVPWCLREWEHSSHGAEVVAICYHLGYVRLLEVLRDLPEWLSTEEIQNAIENFNGSRLSNNTLSHIGQVIKEHLDTKGIDLGPTEVHCPDCNEAMYEVVLLDAEGILVPVETCPKCGFQMTGGDAETIRDEARRRKAEKPLV